MQELGLLIMEEPGVKDFVLKKARYAVSRDSSMQQDGGSGALLLSAWW